MTGEQVFGAVLWVLIFYPVWSPRCRRTRRASASTQRVSAGRQTGPMWEQDKPFPECFDQEIGDDL